MSYQSRVSTLGRVWGFQEPSENGHPYPPSSAPRLVTPGNVDLIETCENLQVAQIDFSALRGTHSEAPFLPTRLDRRSRDRMGPGPRPCIVRSDALCY